MIEIFIAAGTLAVLAGATYSGGKAGFVANPPTISGPGAMSTANCQQACAA